MSKNWSSIKFFFKWSEHFVTCGILRIREAFLNRVFSDLFKICGLLLFLLLLLFLVNVFFLNSFLHFFTSSFLLLLLFLLLFEGVLKVKGTEAAGFGFWVCYRHRKKANFKKLHSSFFLCLIGLLLFKEFSHSHLILTAWDVLVFQMVIHISESPRKSLVQIEVEILTVKIFLITANSLTAKLD